MRRALVISAGLGWSGAVLAQGLGQSADIELMSTSTAARSQPGVPGAVQQPRGTVRTGAFVQYSRSPLVLWRLDTDAEGGAVVAHRWSTFLGASVYATRSVLVEVRVPTLVQWGGELPDLAGDGVGFGDSALRASLLFHEDDRGRASAGLELLLPTAPRGAWMGETEPRLRPGVNGAMDLGAIELLGSLAAELRTPVEAGEAFSLGSRLAADSGLRLALPGDLHPFASLLLRLPLAEAPDALSTEALAGLQWLPEGPLSVDLGAGRGLNQGYGTTAWRVFSGLTWSWEGRDPEPEPVFDGVVEAAPRRELVDKADAPPEQDDDEFWEEEELAKVAGERIFIREPVQFEVGTDRLLDESLPGLQEVAGLLLADPRIVHLVVEGHASEDGADAANYDLSIRRARAVWEQLVAAGVHPDRLSYRGMGEVMPAAAAVQADGTLDLEAALARSRRVEFHIVHQLAQGQAVPTYRQRPPAPWGRLRVPGAGTGARLDRSADAADEPVDLEEEIIEDAELEDIEDVPLP